MNIRRLLGAGVIWLGMSVPAIASLVIKNVEITSLPALYKSDSGLQQRVWINIVHEGDVEPIVLQLGEVTKKVKLHSGENNFYIEIPEVSQAQEDVLTVKQGREILYTEPIKINPVRHWQMNLVQHTHTDIGYTRSQMEILAEHLRYIDYALDYCDATDNYPESAKFRWTCEISWAVSEYLKCRPAEQIARLKQRVKEGRIELATMYLNFDELPDEQTLATSLAPLKQFRQHGMRAELAMQDDVNGIGWCFSEYFADAGVKYLNMGTHGHRALICFDKPTVFWWKSPSGKKMLAYRAEHYNQGNFFGIHNDDFESFDTKVLE